MPSQIEDPFLGLASGPADGAVAQALRAAVEARDVVENPDGSCTSYIKVEGKPSSTIRIYGTSFFCKGRSGASSAIGMTV